MNSALIRTNALKRVIQQMPENFVYGVIGPICNRQYMSNDDLKRMFGAYAALGFLLLPGLCALPLLALITPTPARYLFLGVWAVLVVLAALLVARLVWRLRRKG